MLRLKRAAPRRKLSGVAHARIAGGIYRAARSAAEADHCIVAELLLAMSGPDFRTASARIRRPGAALKLYDAGREMLDAAKAVQECRARAQAKTPEPNIQPSEPMEG